MVEESEEIKFGDEQLPVFEQEKTIEEELSKPMSLVIKYSRGLIKNKKQVVVFLVIFSLLLFIVSFLLIFTQGSSPESYAPSAETEFNEVLDNGKI